MRGKLSAICLLPSVFILTACGGGNNATKTTTVTASASAASTTARTTSSSPTPTGSGDPVYDKYAAAMQSQGIQFLPGLGPSSGYTYDKQICKWLRDGSKDAYELKWYWLAEATQGGDSARRIPVGIPMLCPDQQSVLDEALGPDPKMLHFRTGGKDFVGIGYPGGHPKIQPGTYKTGQVEDCYWARLDDQGNIIDNNFVSISESVVVTIAPTDSAFESNHCSMWTRVD